MPKIYQDYDDEPDDVFLPLPEEMACEFYRLEMDGFGDDIELYRTLLPKRGRILEMGCGTGRIARAIAENDRQVTGIDISLPMLRLAARQQTANCRFLCMDMTATGFRQPFDIILIPYNTLNLLTTEDRIQNCLKECKAALHPGGELLLQIFVPPENSQDRSRATFQFQMFDRPGGGRIIKEIIKRPKPDASTIEIEERFRVRPMQQGMANEDYHTLYTIASLPMDRWLTLFANAGFISEDLWSSYDRLEYDKAPSTCCLCRLCRK